MTRLLEFETLAFEPRGPHVGILYLDRPHRANSMNTQMGLDLRTFFSDLYVDFGELRCLILTGRGEKVFCAGGDLKDRDGMTDEQWQHQHAIFEQAIRAIRDCPVPIIAAVNGAAFGGGCEIALAVDFIYAAESARFALTEVTLGIMPGAMGTQNLPLAIGERRAKEFILSGKAFTAAEALQFGLVNKVCPQSQLLTQSAEVATRIADNAPIAVRQAKKSISIANQVDRHTGYQFELEAYNRMVSTEDRAEGIQAFNEKRKPLFKGR